MLPEDDGRRAGVGWGEGVAEVDAVVVAEVHVGEEGRRCFEEARHQPVPRPALLQVLFPLLVAQLLGLYLKRKMKRGWDKERGTGKRSESAMKMSKSIVNHLRKENSTSNMS